MFSLAFAVRGSQSNTISQTPLHKLKVWYHPASISVQPVPLLGSKVCRLYWTHPDSTDCGLKSLMQPFLCLHLPSSVFQFPLLHIPHFFLSTDTSMMSFLFYIPAPYPVYFQHTLFISFLLLCLAPLLPDDAFTHQIHTSDSSSCHSVLLSQVHISMNSEMIAPFHYCSLQ